MKKGGGKNKGSSFERKICKELSLWWSGGKSDSIFYRTGGSGGTGDARRRVDHGQTAEEIRDDAPVETPATPVEAPSEGPNRASNTQQSGKQSNSDGGDEPPVDPAAAPPSPQEPEPGRIRGFGWYQQQDGAGSLLRGVRAEYEDGELRTVPMAETRARDRRCDGQGTATSPPSWPSVLDSPGSRITRTCTARAGRARSPVLEAMRTTNPGSAGEHS